MSECFPSKSFRSPNHQAKPSQTRNAQPKSRLQKCWLYQAKGEGLGQKRYPSATEWGRPIKCQMPGMRQRWFYQGSEVLGRHKTPLCNGIGDPNKESDATIAKGLVSLSKMEGQGHKYFCYAAEGWVPTSYQIPLIEIVGFT